MTRRRVLEQFYKSNWRKKWIAEARPELPRTARKNKSGYGDEFDAPSHSGYGDEFDAGPRYGDEFDVPSPGYGDEFDVPHARQKSPGYRDEFDVQRTTGYSDEFDTGSSFYGDEFDIQSRPWDDQPGSGGSRRGHGGKEIRGKHKPSVADIMRTLRGDRGNLERIASRGGLLRMSNKQLSDPNTSAKSFALAIASQATVPGKTARIGGPKDYAADLAVNPMKMKEMSRTILAFKAHPSFPNELNGASPKQIIAWAKSKVKPTLQKTRSDLERDLGWHPSGKRR